MTFTDAARHVEIEDERLGAVKSVAGAFVAESSSKRASGFKRKRNWNKSKKGKETGEGSKKNNFNPNRKTKRKQFGKKKNKSKMKCNNFHMPGHFARECPEPKNVSLKNASISVIYVSSTILLTKSYHVWVVDSRTTDHVTRDREVYVDFRRGPSGTRWIYVGNNARVELKGIGTCKLELCGSRTLILHDVLYAPEIRRNLIFVVVLLGLGFSLNFSRDVVSIYDNSMYYGCGHLRDDFIVLDCDRQMFNYYVDRCVSLNVCSSSSAYIDDYTWHARLGHIGQERMNRLVREGLFGSLSKVDLPTCEHCLAGKMTQKPFGKAIRAEFPLQLIHSDICGPMSVKARHGV